MRKKIIVLAAGVLAVAAAGVIMLYRSSGSKGENNSVKYDENNIGELYCAPIDEEHIVQNDSGVMFIDNEVLVVAAEGVAKDQMSELAKKYNAEIVGCIEQTGDYQLKLSSVRSESELDNIVEELKNDSLVDDAYRNYVSEILEDSIPESQNIQYGSEWSADLSNSTDNAGRSWGVEAINAPVAWTFMNNHKTDIDPVRVGLVDGGFDETHTDLSFAKVFYDNGANRQTVPTEDKFHGTHVAGTMAAIGTNNVGINGVYPYGEGRLYGVSRIGIKKYDSNRYSSSMYSKIAFAELVLRNVKVINLSQNDSSSRVQQIQNKDTGWKAASDDLYYNADIVADFLMRLLDQGYDFVIVSSAGNDANSNDINLNWESEYNSFINAIQKNKYRDVYNRIIVVGSVGNLRKNNSGATVVDSNNEPTLIDKYTISYFSYAGNRVDIFAPGAYIYSTLPTGNNYDNKKYNNGALSGVWNGTSMATPHVSGVCANVWSINNALTGEQVKQIVCDSIVQSSECPTNDGLSDADKQRLLSEGRLRELYKYPVVDCNKAVNEAYRRKNKGSSSSGQTSTAPQNGSALGWVYESDRKTAIPDVKVTPWSKGAVLKDNITKTDEYGHFEIILPAGEYELEFSKDGYVSRKLKATIKNGGVNYFNEGIDEVIALKKELTDAEKYAQIVIANESVWLNSLHLEHAAEKPTTTTMKCWFEDLDFDGKPEFVIGPTNILWGMSIGHYYDIYKFKGDKMVKVKSNDVDLSPGASFSADSAYVPDFETNGLNLSLYKDKNGNYKYVYTCVTSYILEECFVLCYVDFSSDTVSKTSTFSYYDIGDGTPRFTNLNGTVTKLQLINDIKNEIRFDKMCKVNTKTITLTNDYGEITSSDYSRLSSDEKKKQLINSYNGYRIIEMLTAPDFFEFMLRSLETTH